MTFNQILSHNNSVSTSSIHHASNDSNSDATLPKTTADLAGTKSDQLTRFLRETAPSKSPQTFIAPFPAPPFLTESLQLIPSDCTLEPGKDTPQQIVKQVCKEIESIVTIEKVYLYGGIIREELSSKRTHEIACALTGINIPDALISEPKERVPDADIGIKVAVPDPKSYFTLRHAINRAVAKLYPRQGSEYVYETNVRIIDTGYGADIPNQFFLIQIVNKKHKNIEIKIWWELARSNLFTVTGWQADWDYQNNVLGPLYHSEGALRQPFVDWITRKISATRPEEVNYRGWTREQSLLCSDYTSDQIELEPILWQTLNAFLAKDRASILVDELMQCLKVHYPNDYDFAVQFLFHTSLTLHRQGDEDLAAAIWSAATQSRLDASTSTSALWKGIAAWLFQNPSDLLRIADLFALAAFLKLGTSLADSDCMQQVELTNHLGNLHWHFTFPAHRSTLIIPVEAKVFEDNTLTELEPLFQLPKTPSVDGRLAKLGISLRLSQPTLFATALRLKLSDLYNQPLNDSYFDEIANLLKQPKLPSFRVNQLGTRIKDWAFPLSEKALASSTDTTAIQLAFVCDLAATEDAVAVRYASNKFREMKLPSFMAKGALRFVCSLGETSIDLALDHFQRCLEEGLFNPIMDLAAEAFAKFKPTHGENAIAQAQTLTRFYRCSKLLKPISVDAVESFRKGCQVLMQRAAKNEQYKGSAWKWYSELNAIEWPNQQSGLLISILEAVSVEELSPAWEKIEASGILLSDEWIDPCLKLLEKTIPLRWHSVPKSSIWNRLKKANLTSSQTLALEGCVKSYHNHLVYRNDWALALKHHAENPRNDASYVQSWIELLTKIQTNGHGSIWNYVSQVCEAADRIDLVTSESVLKYYLEHLPPDIRQHKAEVQLLAFIQWCRRILTQGKEFDLALSLIGKITNWEVDGLAEGFILPVLDIASKTEKCNPDSLKTLCSLASQYHASLDDHARYALLKLVYRQETVENSWNYTLKALEQWANPLTVEAAEVVFERCGSSWKACATPVEARFEQLQKIEGHCEASAFTGRSGDFRNELVLSIVDVALKEKRLKLAWKGILKHDACTGNESRGVVTERHRNYVALKISLKEAADVIAIFCQSSEWTTWENEWLMLMEGDYKASVAKMTLKALLPYIPQIKKSAQIERWKKSLLLSITQLSQSQQDAASAVQLLKDFEDLLPAPSYKLMYCIVDSCATSKQRETAEQYLLGWARTRPLDPEVALVWADYLKAATHKTVEALVDWLKINNADFVRLKVSEELKYQIYFKLVAQMVHTEGEKARLRSICRQIAQAVGVNPDGPAPTSGQLWLRASCELLQKIPTGGSYLRLVDVFDLIGNCCIYINDIEDLVAIQGAYLLWIESVTQFIPANNNTLTNQSFSDHDALDDLSDKALAVMMSRKLYKAKHSSKGVPVVTLTKKLLNLFAKLGRFYPKLYKEKTAFTKFLEEAALSPSLIESFTELVTNWLRSDQPDHRFALIQLNYAYAQIGDLATLFEPIWKSIRPLLKAKDIPNTRVGYILGAYTNWGYYNSNKLIPAYKQIIDETNDAGLRLLLSSEISNPIFYMCHMARARGVLIVLPRDHLAAGGFYETQKEYIQKILAAIEKHPTKKCDLITYACMQALLMIQTQEQADTHTFDVIRMIYDAITQHKLWQPTSGLEAVVVGEFVDLACLATEIGVFTGRHEFYTEIYTRLFAITPVADPNKDPFILRAELWDGLCGLAQRLHHRELTNLIFRKLQYSLIDDKKVRARNKNAVITRQWELLKSAVRHLILSESKKERKQAALARAYTILVYCLRQGHFDDFPNNFESLYNAVFNVRVKFKPDTRSRMLWLISEILTLHKSIQLVDSILPQIIKLLQEAWALLMLGSHTDIIKVLDLLIPLTPVNIDIIDVTHVEELYTTATENEVYKSNPQLLVSHGMMLQATAPKFLSEVENMSSETKAFILNVLLQRLAGENSDHINIMTCCLNIMHTALAVYGIRMSNSDLHKLRLKLISQPSIYTNSTFEAGIRNTVQMIEHSSKATLEETFELLEAGLLNRDAEFEKAFKDDPVKAKVALCAVFAETFRCMQRQIPRMSNSEFVASIPVWYQRVIFKAQYYHSIANCPELKAVLEAGGFNEASRNVISEQIKQSFKI